MKHLTGHSDDHVTEHLGHRINKNSLSDFQKMCEAAKNEGIEIQIFSAFRDYERQLKIWSAKAQGKRKLLSHDGSQITSPPEDPADLALVILRWSALPGGSRHHWGTDIDIIDTATIDENYEVLLEPSEYAEGGPFHRLDQWLRENMNQFGFFRPYENDLGGVAPEAWHLSHFPVSNDYQKQYTSKFFEEYLAQSNFDLIESVREQSTEIFNRFINVPRHEEAL